MATTTSNLGLTIWNSDNDFFDYSVLARNFTAIDAQFASTTVTNTKFRFAEDSATVPAGTQTNGRLVYLTAANSGFTANTLIQYRNGQWYEVGQPEVVSSAPASNNFIGRMVVFNATSGGFVAGDVAVCTNIAGSGTYTKINYTIGNAANLAAISNPTINQLYVITSADSSATALSNGGPYPAYSLAYCTATSPSAAYSPIVGVPTGTVMITASTTIPTGWLECNGNSISRSDYAKLFAAIGTTYGSASGSTFNVPNITGPTSGGVTTKYIIKV